MKKYVLGYELFVESIKQGKMYIDQGKIDNETFEKIKEIDTSKNKKYVGWLTKQYIEELYDIELLKSYIEEYIVLSDRKLINTDINSFKSIEDFKHQVDNVNNTKSATRKELETDYDVIIDNDDLLLIRPNTFEASRKLGLTVFKHRNNEKTGQQDSAWCTTYSNREHWDDYFYDNDVTFYYCKLKNNNIKNELEDGFHNVKLNVFAIAVMKNGSIEMYDANDIMVSIPEIIINQLNIKNLLVPNKISERNGGKKKILLDLLNQEEINGELILNPNSLDDFNIKVNCKKINGIVRLNGGFSEIPLFFKNIIITGSFDCSINYLLTLENAPNIINGNFICARNYLISLKGAPNEVLGSFDCSYNKLESLEFSPKKVTKSYICNDNKLVSLKGSPDIINGNFYCSNNKLTTLDGAPSIIKGTFVVKDNITNFTSEEVLDKIEVQHRIIV